MKIQNILVNNPIIAASQYKDLQIADESLCSAIIFMNANLTELMDKPKVQKPIFLHLDLIRGLKSDKEAISFLKNVIQPTGIVTTKGQMIEFAKKQGLLTIQRIFLIDTKSLNTAIHNIKEHQPDAIEVMPGIAPTIVKRLKEELDIPIILAGLISSREDVERAFQAGADAISLSNQELWNVAYKKRLSS